MQIIDKEINYLDLEKNIKIKLENSKINFIKDLWILKRNDLKKMNFSDYEIKKIIISLELNGLDLNKKNYN